MPNYETNPDILRKDAEEAAVSARDLSSLTGPGPPDSKARAVVDALRALQLEIRAASIITSEGIDHIVTTIGSQGI